MHRTSLKSIEAAGLDGVTRSVLRRWTVCVLIIAGLSCAASACGTRTFGQACDGLAHGATIAGLITMFAASLRGERAGKGSLNGWDEAFAFMAVGLLAKVLR